MAQNDNTVLMEGVKIIFRNFEGKEGQYNRAGERNFAVLLDPQTAEMLAADGWNVKWLKPREDAKRAKSLRLTCKSQPCTIRADRPVSS